jgi:thioredoxin-dependent peroxiredoxin
MSDRITTLKGDPLTLAGAELSVGQAAPVVTVRKNLLEDISLGEFAGSVRIFSVVPSVDTSVCALQTKRFNEEAAQLIDVNFITISCDLPVAQGRFCGQESINPEHMHVFSDHKDIEFSSTYGTLISELRLSCRALFVVGKDDSIAYAEYVSEIADHPDYDAALSCAKCLL